MRDALIVPSFRANGLCVELSDFLRVIPGNNLVWTILYFYGIGVPPNNLSMDEFEHSIREQPGGFIISWSDLNQFSSSIDQTFDCIVLGVRSENDISSTVSMEDERFCSGVEIILKAFDCTEWLVWARDELIMKKLEKVSLDIINSDPFLKNIHD